MENKCSNCKGYNVLLDPIEGDTVEWCNKLKCNTHRSDWCLQFDATDNPIDITKIFPNDPTAYWVNLCDGKWYCSNCRFLLSVNIPIENKYCGKCGRKMIGYLNKIG